MHSYCILFEMITHLVFYVTHWAEQSAEGQRQILLNLCVPGALVRVSAH